MGSFCIKAGFFKMTATWDY